MNDKAEPQLIDLRQLAECRVRPAHIDISELSAEDIKRLVYELEVHQEELEIQNEELRRIQRELHTSRDMFADLYDFAPVGYVSVGEIGHVVEANLTACTMLGVDRSNLIGARLAIYCDTPSRIELHAHLNVVLSSKALQTCELTFNRRTGGTFDARVDSRIAEDIITPQIRVVITDISEQKESQRALLEKDKYLRSLGDALPVLIGYLDSGLKYQFANAAHGDWFGVTADALVGQPIQDVFGPDSSAEMADYLAYVLDGGRVDFELDLVHCEKGNRQVQIMLVPDRAPNGEVRGIHSLVIDVTERKIVEEQSARRRKLAERLVLLTANERDVYELLVRGKSNKAVAMELDIGLRTAVRRRQNIFEKLQVASMADLLQKLSNIQGYRPEPDFHS